MKRKRHNKGDIFIDLTSLLDVVFIFLMIIMYNQQNVINDVLAQQAEALEMTEQAMVQLQLYTDQMETADDLYLVSVNARYEPDNVTKRRIFVQKKGEEIEEIDLIGNNTDEAFNRLETILKNYIAYVDSIDPNKIKPIILSLNENDENILYRDEKKIKEIFEEFKNSYENIFIK